MSKLIDVAALLSQTEGPMSSYQFVLDCLDEVYGEEYLDLFTPEHEALFKLRDCNYIVDDVGPGCVIARKQGEVDHYGILLDNDTVAVAYARVVRGHLVAGRMALYNFRGWHACLRFPTKRTKKNEEGEPKVVATG